MDRSIILLSLVCFMAGGVSASSEKHFDFGAFNKWLVNGLPDNQDAAANVAFVRGNLGQLRGQKARAAGEFLMAIVETNECNKHLLQSLKHVLEDRVDLNEELRVFKIIRSSSGRVNELCGPVIDQQAEELNELSLDDHLREMVAYFVRPRGGDATSATGGLTLDAKKEDQFLWYTANFYYKKYDPWLYEWAANLRHFAQDDQRAREFAQEDDKRTGKSRIVYHRENFDYGFNKYLVEPCKRLTSVLEDTIKSLYGLAQVQCPSYVDYKEFILNRTNTVQRLSFAYKTCSALLALKKKKIDELYKDNFTYKLPLKKRAKDMYNKLANRKKSPYQTM